MDLSPSSEQAERLETIFGEAVELDSASRSTYLDRVCRSDPDLRTKVDSLIHAFEEHAAAVRELFEELPLARPEGIGAGSDGDPQDTLGLVGRQIGHYRILDKLGGGGMGVVYQAHDPRLDRTVALKFLPRHSHADEEATTRFRHEAQAASALDHANICTIHDIGETDEGRLFIAMAYYRGETLKRKIERGALAKEEALDYALQVARGLEKAHSAGIVHRDIKPANILVTDDGVAKILDFGIAKISGVDLTRSGATMGTVSHMSPEQVRGDEVDHRTDIWSLGAVLFEMITGRRPFAGDYDHALIYSILNTEPDFDAIDDADLRAVVEACLRKDPDERLASAGELAEALASLAEGSPVTTISLPRRRKKASAFTIGASVLAVAIIALATWFFSQPGAEEAGPPERQMLVVLPFENLGDPEDQYFADGMAEELSTRLASVQSLGVLSRNTANRYRGTTKTAPEIGEELGVDYVIGGTVRWAGQSGGTRRVRIAPYLTRVSDDLQLWAESYDRGLSDVLGIQRDVAIQVVENLQLTLDPEEVEQLSVRLTDDPDAYQEYLKGLDLHRRAWLPGRMSKVYGEEAHEAIEHLNRAVELDSSFAAAAYLLARTAGGVAWYLWYAEGTESEELTRLAEKGARLARDADPGSHFDLLANGYLNEYIRRDYAAALALFTRAADMAEDVDVLVAIADIQARLGNYKFSIDYLDRALELDPQRSDLMRRAASHSRFIRRYDKVLAYSIRAHAGDSTEMSPCSIADLQLHIDWNTKRARQTLATAPGPVEHCHVLDFFDRRFELLLDHHDAGEDIWSAFMLEVYRQLGLRERRAEILRGYKVAGEEGDVAPKINKFGFLAIGEAGLGNRDEALVALDSFRVNVTRDRGVTLSNYNTFAAIVYLLLDMYDELFEVLEVEASRPGFMDVVWLRFPWFDPVRDDPRFQTVMNKFEAWERDVRR